MTLKVRARFGLSCSIWQLDLSPHDVIVYAGSLPMV
jgi:hypothetical protein